MTDPFKTLGVSPNADEATIRKHYLALVKQFTPEKSPREFADIRAAYDAVRDPISRIQRQLFQIHSSESIEEIMAEVQSRVRRVRVPVDVLLSLAEG